jgi:hypothetical protein
MSSENVRQTEKEIRPTDSAYDQPDDETHATT